MKKYILLFALILSLFVSTIAVNAQKAPETAINELYIMTEKCPPGAITYATNNWQRFVADIQIQDTKYHNIELAKLSIGSPFKMVYEGGSSYIPLYFFPVYYNSDILFTMRVYEDTDGLYKGILSEDLVPELNQLLDCTSPDNPALFSVNNGNILLAIGNKKDVVIPDAFGKKVLTIVGESAQIELTVENINKTPLSYKADTTLSNISNLYSARAVYPGISDAKYLYLDLAERQGQTNWCAAYATASIIRYMTHYDHVYAESIISYFHPHSTNLAIESISPSEVISYSEIYGLSPLCSYYALGSYDVAVNIDSDRPLIADVSSISGLHSLVIRGYSLINNTYSVWNPWNYSYVNMDATTNIYVDPNGASWEYVRSIYDF